MTYKEVLQAAQGQMGPCRACPVCNGRACGGTIPGPGAKGSGTVAVRNFDAWRNVRLNMDTIHENFEPDTSLTLFGRSFKYPFFAGPVGAMTLHYGDKYNDLDYNNILVSACAAAGIAAFTGDGTNHKVMEGAAAAITACGGAGIPTVKPWDNATVARKIALARSSGCFAMAMDIDAAGLPFLQHLDPPAGSKTVEQLKEIALAAGVPFILKGIMTVKGAEKAIEAGAAGIVVSNHGGRVLDDCPATQEVLADIVAASEDGLELLDCMGSLSACERAEDFCEREGVEKGGFACASDAFFPFRDNVDVLAAHGVTCIIQPGGSKRDDESIQACNEHNIAMVFTGARHFRH